MANAVTSGTWVKISNGLPRLAGLKSNQVNWGVPGNRARRQSGYRFAGRKVPLQLDGKEFVLGTFTHNNFPIRPMGSNRFSVELQVAVVFDEGGLRRNFKFTFDHFETPNRGNRRQQADQVALSSVRSSETVEIDGERYAVEIVGFKQDGKVVKKFISFENAANSAVIVAKLVHIPKPKPEPAPEPAPAPEPEPAPAPEPEPEPESEPEPDESTTYTFQVLNPDGSVFGRGCFTFDGDELPVDLAHVMSGKGRGQELTSFWYHDPLVGTMDMSQLLAMNFVHGVDGKPSRFTLNAGNVPEDTHALAGGVATLDEMGAVSVHRNDSESASCAGRKLTFPTPCRHVVSETQTENTIPEVDLVVVMDSSVSMRPDAITLSGSISAAIESAQSKCPSDLKVTYLGIEGRFSKSLFDTTIRQHLIALGVDESVMRGRKRGTVESGGAQEDGARAIEDVSLHHDWRPDAKRAIFFLGDEGLEGGDTVDENDIEAATQAIDVATTAGVRVHTYLADSKAKPAIRALNESEYERVASGTGGRFFTAQNAGGTLNGFQGMLETVICASKVDVGVAETEPCPCTQAAVESAPK